MNCNISRSEGRSTVRLSESTLDSIFADMNSCTRPGVAVGVAVHGSPFYRKGFGLASMELPVCLSPSMRMRTGSVSKQFTALAYLLLCEDGKATLEDPLGKFFPHFNSAVQKVTMLGLLGHTSGLRDAADMRFRFGGLEGRPVSTAEILGLYKNIEDVDAEPETTWIYNNAGYMILSTVVEMLADRPFGDFLKERIFSPLGMYDTVVRSSDIQFTTNSATPHTAAGNDLFEKRYWGIEFGGAGSLTSTVDDLLRWLRHMDAPIVGNSKTWSVMLTPQRLLNGTSTGYGCGLIRSRYRGIDIICHGGGWIGGNAQALKVPAHDLDVVVLSNRSDVFSPVLVNRILDECLPDLEPAHDSGPARQGSEGFSLYRMDCTRVDSKWEHTAGPDSHARFLTGLFRSGRTGRIIQLFPKDGRQIVSIDGHDLPYDHMGERKLEPISIWSHVKRYVELLGDPRHPSALRLKDFGEVDELSSIDSSIVPQSRPMLGTFREHATGAIATILVGASGLQLRVESPYGSVEYGAEPLTDVACRITCLSSSFLDAIITFTSTYDAFHLSSYNVRRLCFRRIAETR